MRPLNSYNGEVLGSISSSEALQQSIKNEKPWELGYGYEVTTEFVVPNLVSGIYLIENITIIELNKTEPPINNTNHPNNG